MGNKQTSCDCIDRVRYALKCSYISCKIFQEYQCSCSQSKNGYVCKNGYVRCMLYTDDPVSSCENMNNWVTTYHGAPVETIQSILLHGEMLMAGDVLLDGSYLERSLSQDDEEQAIWTYPKFEAAENRIEVAKFDKKDTVFQMILELRQRPDTFTKDSTGWGHEIYATNKRGTIALWAVHIKITKITDIDIKRSSQSFNKSNMDEYLVVQHSNVGLYDTYSSKNYHLPAEICHARKNALKALKKLNMPEGIFDRYYDRCYCSFCYTDNKPVFKNVAGENMVVPKEWVKFGIKVNRSFAVMNDVWDCWNTAFHGCAPDKVISILKHRTLLIPGDYLYNGTKLGVNSSADINQKCYFFSPTIIYSCHSWYARFEKIEDKYFQTVLLFKVRPSSFDKQAETEGGAMKLIDNYTVIPEDEVEWYSSRRGCSIPYAILVRVIDEDMYKTRNQAQEEAS